MNIGLYLMLGLVLVISGMLVSAVGLYAGRVKKRKKCGTTLFGVGFVTFVLGLLMLFFNLLGVGMWI